MKVLSVETHLPPGKGLDDFDARDEVELLQQHPAALLEVHGVEVQALDADVRSEDLPAEVGDELRAQLADLLVVILVRLELVQEKLRDRDLGHLRRLLEAVPRLDGHDPRDDGHRDPGGPGRLDPRDEHVDVVEHLREDEVRTGVDLVLEVLHLACGLLWGQVLGLRIAGDGNVEVVAILGADVPHEVNAVGETPLDSLPFLANRWVAAERKDIATPVLLRFLHHD